MSSYITLKHIQIQNANCIAGVTYGFPAITHFLGFIRALSLKLQPSCNIVLDGCAIICHQYQIHAYQPEKWSDYVFSQTRNPLKKDGKPNSIVEEGKMHLTVSLVVECSGITGDESKIHELQKYIKNIAMTHKLAGGVINSLSEIIIESANTDDEYKKLTRKICRSLLPGFLLLNKSNYLSKHFQQTKKNNLDIEMIDAWLDFYTLKCKAEPRLEDNEELDYKAKADWQYIPKPNLGYLVPLLIGYKALKKYKAGEVANARDFDVPFCFVEAVYGIGQWQSPNQLQDIRNALWKYEYKKDWYLCKNTPSETISDFDDDFDFI